MVDTNLAQPGILDALPQAARYLTFHLERDADPREVLERLSILPIDGTAVVGLGLPLADALGEELPGLRLFPAYSAAGVEVPSTPAALWVWLRDDDRGELVHRSRELISHLAGPLVVEPPVDAFMHRGGRDLTGYEDGTENPEGDAAAAAALAAGGPGIEGGAFVSVQCWTHDLAHFTSLPSAEQDHIIGRRRSDNEELDDAPASAHVKRTAQEDFDPEAFVLRRSMPWSGPDQAGLVFVAFGRTLDPFEAQLRRMCGKDDGIVDGLFRFTRPVSGAHFFCPPRKDGRLDLRALDPL